MEGNTAALRSSAVQWSLAGDKQLLDILNNIHQSLVSRCQEVNRKLDEMVSALDGASVDLQNVNNKFMALSNSQFIESRVYDDDVDIAAQEPPKETPKPQSLSSDISSLKRSVATLVAAHDTIEIMASDSEDDDEVRVVLKPKDMYTHRPLPHIIGSAAWRNKWHAGLHPEDSDSDSSTSKRENPEEDFSESEPEESVPPPAMQRERKASSASSELPSEHDMPTPAPTAVVKPSPSDVAAELARRLGGQHVQIPVQEPEYVAPNPTTRKVYKPEQPTPGTIFSDEPPPLDDYQSESSEPPEDDIFAELHMSQPYAHSNKEQSRMAQDLFAGLKEYEVGDVFSDFNNTQPTSTAAAKQKSTLFEDVPEPELFVPKQDMPAPKPSVKPDKKPVGGISLFGNTQGTESIGAAILQRKIRKSSSDEDEVEETPKHDETKSKSKEKDIFDDLFAKSEKEQKKNTKNVLEKQLKEPKKPKHKIDLFSDNIFDDIDDIFTTNVSQNVKSDNKKKKPLFDDDKDLFSDIAVAETENNTKEVNKSDKNKSIFDSDDDLFSDNVTKTENKNPVDEKGRIEESSKQTTSALFESEIDDLFTKSDIKNDNLIVNADVTNEITNNVHSNSRNMKQNDNFNNTMKKPTFKDHTNNVTPNDNTKTAAKSIFDDEDDENDDLFSSTASKSSTSDQNTLTSSLTQGVKSKDQKSSLFDDDIDDSDLFGSKVTEKSTNNNDIPHNNVIKAENAITSSLFDDAKTEDIFAHTSNQISDKNNTAKQMYQIENNKSTKETEARKEIKKRASFSDEEESLFADSNKKPVLDKPKPELMKKPTVKPTNNNNVPIKQDISKNNQKNDVKKENGTKQNFEDFSSSKPVEKQVVVEQDKLKLGEEKIESKLLLTEEKPIPIVQENKPEITPEIIEHKSQVVDEKQPNNATQNKLDLKYDIMKSNFPEPISEVPPPLDLIDNDDDIFADQPNDSITKDSVFQTPSVFDDIFSEPPAFEKSKEPKKSKNINALFDDDSEDEALFFKKNEPVVDEKPDVSLDVNRDALFGIFHDEPPAIDVDFTQKPSKSNNNDEFLKSDSNDDLFGTRKSPEDTFESDSKPVLDTIENKTQVKKDEMNKEEKHTVLEKPKPHIRESQIDTTENEPKKVGKLKTMNFNIDVSTLLPGASPKRKFVDQVDTKSDDLFKKDTKKSLEQTDGQIFAKSNEDIHSKEEVEPIMVKSVSFEGEPDSRVLDNKISKERAKIQVKRRPSTRRARKEAVRKSAIHFGDDSTDNSSSVDDPPKRVPEVDSKVEDNEETEKTNKISTDLIESTTKLEVADHILPEVQKDLTTTNEIQTNIDNNTAKDSILPEENKPNVDSNKSDELDSTTKVEQISHDIESNTSNVLESDDIFTSIISDRFKQESTIKVTSEIKDQPTQLETSELKTEPTKTVTSKIVYILNDEDIFSTPPETKSSSFDIDDVDLFRSDSNTSKSNPVVSNVSTLGNVYKDDTKNTKIVKRDNKKSLFDDLSDSDDELFTIKKPTTKSKGILDSDSEEDLFGGRKNGTKDSKPTRAKETKDDKVIGAKETKDEKKVEVKASLFGDEDDDDDLFGTKVKNNPAPSPLPSRSTREPVSKSTELVFDDPLSILGHNDD